MITEKIIYKVGPNGEPIASPFICLKNSLLNKTNGSEIVMVSKSWKSVMVKPSMLGLSLSKSSTQMSIVSCKGILKVKINSTSKLAIAKLES